MNLLATCSIYTATHGFIISCLHSYYLFLLTLSLCPCNLKPYGLRWCPSRLKKCNGRNYIAVTQLRSESYLYLASCFVSKPPLGPPPPCLSNLVSIIPLLPTHAFLPVPSSWPRSWGCLSACAVPSVWNSLSPARFLFSVLTFMRVCMHMFTVTIEFHGPFLSI